MSQQSETRLLESSYPLKRTELGGRKGKGGGEGWCVSDRCRMPTDYRQGAQPLINQPGASSWGFAQITGLKPKEFELSVVVLSQRDLMLVSLPLSLTIGRHLLHPLTCKMGTAALPHRVVFRSK